MKIFYQDATAAFRDPYEEITYEQLAAIQKSLSSHEELCLDRDHMDGDLYFYLSEFEC